METEIETVKEKIRESEEEIETVKEVEELVRKVCTEAIFRIDVSAESDKSGMAYIRDQWVTDLDAVWIKLNMYGPGFPREDLGFVNEGIRRRILFVPKIHKRNYVIFQTNQAISSMLIQGIQKNADFAQQVQQVITTFMLDRSIRDILKNFDKYCYIHNKHCIRQLAYGTPDITVRTKCAT